MKEQLKAHNIHPTQLRRVGSIWGFVGEYTLMELDVLFDLPFFASEWQRVLMPLNSVTTTELRLRVMEID